MIGTALSALTSPVARYVAAGLAVLAVVGWLRHDAAQDARTEAEAAFRERLAAARAEGRQEAALAAEQVEKRFRRMLVAEAEARQEIKEKADALRSALDEVGERRECALDDDLRQRLRDIR